MADGASTARSGLIFRDISLQAIVPTITVTGDWQSETGDEAAPGRSGEVRTTGGRAVLRCGGPLLPRIGVRRNENVNVVAQRRGTD